MNPSSTIRTLARTAMVLLLVVVGVGALLILTANPRSRSQTNVKILDPKLDILWVRVVKGNRTYYLPKDPYGCNGRLGNRVEGYLRRQLARTGLDIRTMSAFHPGTGTNGRAFFVGYAFPLPPGSTDSFSAEVIAPDGTGYPLRSAAGGGGGPPQRSWNLWVVDSMPLDVTNYALRFKSRSNGPLLGEVQVTDH